MASVVAAITQFTKCGFGKLGKNDEEKDSHDWLHLPHLSRPLSIGMRAT